MSGLITGKRLWLLAVLSLTFTLVVGLSLPSGIGAPVSAVQRVQQEVTIEAVGHFAGWMAAVAVPPIGGDYIYLGEGGGLTVMDVADKSQPRQVASLPLTGTDVADIVIDDTTAYLVNGDGMWVVDLSDPINPTLLGGYDTSETTRAVYVAGSYAYVASSLEVNDGWLHVVDVSDPTTPREVGSFDTPGPANDVYVAGSAAYVADGSEGLIIVNVSNPANPTLLGSEDTPGYAQAVHVTDNTAYVADAWAGLQIVGVSSPASPTLLGAYDTPGSASAVQVVGHTAYVADGNPGLQILDVSNRTNPTLIATSDSAWSAFEVAIAGSHAFVGGEEGLRILDVSNAASPAVLGAYERPSDVADVFVQGPYGYVAGVDKFWVVDLMDPANPRPVGAGDLQSGNWTDKRLDLSETLAYLTEEDYGMQIFDVSDPENPALTGQYRAPSGATANDVFVYDQHAYVPIAFDSDGRLHIVDVSNPASPNQVGVYNTPGDARRVFVSDDTAHVADGEAGLRLVDVSNPATPMGVGHAEPPVASATTDVVFVTGDRAYVGSNTDTEWWLQAFDVSDPTDPSLVNSYHATGHVNDIEVYEDYVYLAVSGGSLHMLDRESFVEVGAYYIPYTYSVHVYYSESTSTLYVFLDARSYGWWTIIIQLPPAGPTATSSPSATSSSTATSSPTVTGSPTATGSPTVTGSPTITGTPPTPTSSLTATTTPTPTPTPTATLTPTPTATLVPEPPDVELISQYEKYFLKDVSLKNCYRAHVDWHGPPGFVEFEKNGRHIGRLNNEPYQMCFDMGFDFKADDNGGGNILKATAVNQYFMEDTDILHPAVFPLPKWARLLLEGPWGTFPLGKLVLYSLEIRYPSPAFIAESNLPSWVPVVGGKWGIGATQARVAMKVRSDGTGFGRLHGQTGIHLGSKAGREKAVAGQLAGEANVPLRPGTGLDLLNGSFSFGIKGVIKDKTGPADMFPALKVAENWWFVGWIIRKFNSLVTLDTLLEPRVIFSLFWKAVNGDLEWDRGEGTGSVKIEAALTLNLWEKLKAAVYGGGIPRLTFQAPPAPSYLKEMGMRLYFGLKLNIWKWEERFERGINCWYPPGQCSATVIQMATALRDENWQLTPRDYVTQDYATFTGNRAAPRLRRTIGIRQTAEETEIVHGVFPLAEPALALRDDSQQLLLWVHDDPAKPNGQGEEILFTHWDGTNWSAPAGITDDNYEDFAPQVAFDGSGHAVAVWERSNLVHPITPTLDITFTQSMEIAYSVWDGAGWSAPALLTDNDSMDYVPRLAQGQDGTVMVLWTTNSGEMLVGDEANPDSFNYAVWDGGAWSAPATALADLTGVLGVRLAYHGPQATIVLSRDTDGDLSTVEDGELFYAEWDGATWGALTQLTDDDVADSVPQVVYDAAGQVTVVWLKGEELVFLADGWAGTPAPLWPDGSVTFANYTLATDPDDNLVLIYQGLSEDGADIYYTVYDEANGLWALASRLTTDLPLEDYLAPAFAPDGTLWIAYTKVETLFEDKEVVIEGEPIIVEDVPVPGRSDLYLLRHTLLPDLAITAEDIVLSVPNPAPGETVVISATVHSAGDLAVADGGVQFYDGDPEAGGVQIGDTQPLISPLRAGITDTVSIVWTVPAQPASHDVYVRVDPLAEIAERDETNNVAYITTVVPDLQIDYLYAGYLAPDMVRFTTAIANDGTIAASDMWVEWHRDAITGTLLGTATVGVLAAGSSEEVGLTWTVSAADVGEHVVYAVVDPEDGIAESDETNNDDLAAADVLPDLTLDGSYLRIAFDADPPGAVPISLVLRNEGVADAEAVPVRVVQGDPFSATSPVLYETVVPAVEAGGEVMLTATVTVTGWGDVYAIADPGWTVDEVYKGNNLALLVDFSPRVYLPLVRR